MPTQADVYIIESLDPDDEGNGRCEGSIISHVLRLHGKSPKYKYVRTRSAFREAVADFAESKYRYLHISAHGNNKAMYTTNNDRIKFAKLAEIFGPCLKNKRLFLSTCSMVHEGLAKKIIPRTRCYSIVGPTTPICFTKAAVIWPLIYHLMFTDRDDAMTHKTLWRHLESVSSLLNVDIGCFSRSKNKNGYLAKTMTGLS